MSIEEMCRELLLIALEDGLLELDRWDSLNPESIKTLTSGDLVRMANKLNSYFPPRSMVPTHP